MRCLSNLAIRLLLHPTKTMTLQYSIFFPTYRQEVFCDVRETTQNASHSEIINSYLSLSLTRLFIYTHGPE